MLGVGSFQRYRVQKPAGWIGTVLGVCIVYTVVDFQPHGYINSNVIFLLSFNSVELLLQAPILLALE